jgi:hypothetical protein
LVNCCVAKTDILKSAFALRSDLESISETAENTIGHRDVPAGAVKSTLQNDRIIARPDITVRNNYSATRVNIDSIVVSVYPAPDGDPMNLHVFAGQVMLHPHGRILQRDTSDSYIPAVHDAKEIRTDSVTRIFERSALPINRSPTGNSDVLGILGID